MVAFASVTERSVWSVALLSIAGPIDYANSFIVLKLSSHGIGVWYAGHAFL